MSSTLRSIPDPQKSTFGVYKRPRKVFTPMRTAAAVVLSLVFTTIGIPATADILHSATTYDGLAFDSTDAFSVFGSTFEFETDAYLTFGAPDGDADERSADDLDIAGGGVSRILLNPWRAAAR